MDTIIQEKESVVAISLDDDTVVISDDFGEQASRGIVYDAIASTNRAAKHLEKVLILGWNPKGQTILEVLDTYVLSGSKVEIWADASCEADVLSLKTTLSRVNLSFAVKDIVEKDSYDPQSVLSFDHVVVLSYPYEDIQEADTKTLIALIYLRKLFEDSDKVLNVVSEMRDLKNRDLAYVRQADDFIVSDKLISLLIAQFAENNDLRKVYYELFHTGVGAQIALLPASNFVQLGVELDFYTVLESVARQ